VVRRWVDGEQLDWITCQSHAPRGQTHPTYWLSTPDGGRALLENEDTIRRFVRRMIGRSRGR
jgi:hypothetical protein